MISHKHKLLFVHISKTGGSSIERALNPKITLDRSEKGSLAGNTALPKKHWPAAKYMNDSPELFESYFSFSFVRNPWDRFVSNWHWLRYLSLLPENLMDDFEAWLVQEVKKNAYSYKRMLTKNNEILVDFVGRFENLRSDFRYVCEKVGIPNRQLPHYNNMSNRQHYSAYYSDKSQLLVAKKFQWEIETFDYAFEPRE